MTGLELEVAEMLYNTYKRTRPNLIRTLEYLIVDKYQRKSRVMEHIHRESLRSAGNGWVMNDLEQIVDYIIHRRRKLSNA